MDPDLAHIYNDTFGIDAAFETRDKQSLSEEYQINYSAQGVCRESDWTAVVRGHTFVLWGCEGFPEDNRYGRYQSYGALQVLYPGGALRGNGYSHAGWDWNYNPGTTAIVLPFTKLRAYRERLDERQKFDFVGASTLNRTNGDVFRETRGGYGMFAMKFQQVENQGFRAVIGPNSHDASFKFKKSTFYFGDYIIALGSNIENDDATNTIVATLAQRLGDRFLDPMTNGKFLLNGNGHEVKEKVELNGRNANCILDNFNTGYVCPPQEADIVFERSVQSAPSYKQVRPNPDRYSSNEFSKVYFDDGVSPSNAGYEYVMIPNSSEVETEALANRINGNVESRHYHVLDKNGKQHIVQFVDGGKDVWAMALFSANTTFPEDSLVLSNDINALVMYEKHGDGKISISATNPDLGIKLSDFTEAEVYTLNLKLSGNWSVSVGNPDVTVNLDGSETNLRFTLSDGLPEDIVLEPVVGKQAKIPPIKRLA